ncbi:MAG: hypothetical protein LBI05_07535 [Planctomycetaceae bacterium]|nr:hypothetical protein [Planctomycetaceae bacterium]
MLVSLIHLDIERPLRDGCGKTLCVLQCRYFDQSRNRKIAIILCNFTIAAL